MIEIIGKMLAPDLEDSGMAMIGDLEIVKEKGTDGHFFVKLQSWNEVESPDPDDPDEPIFIHETLQSLVGKKIRIRIDVVV